MKAQKLENEKPPSKLFSTHCSKASCMYVVFDIKSRVLWWSVHIIHARRNLLLDTSWCITLVWNNNPGLSYLGWTTLFLWANSLIEPLFKIMLWARSNYSLRTNKFHMTSPMPAELKTILLANCTVYHTSRTTDTQRLNS